MRARRLSHTTYNGILNLLFHCQLQLLHLSRHGACCRRSSPGSIHCYGMKANTDPRRFCGELGLNRIQRLLLLLNLARANVQLLHTRFVLQLCTRLCDIAGRGLLFPRHEFRFACAQLVPIGREVVLCTRSFIRTIAQVTRTPAHSRNGASKKSTNLPVVFPKSGLTALSCWLWDVVIVCAAHVEHSPRLPPARWPQSRCGRLEHTTKINVTLRSCRTAAVMLSITTSLRGIQSKWIAVARPFRQGTWACTGLEYAALLMEP